MTESLEELAARMSPPSHVVFIEDDQVVYRSDDHLTLTLVASKGGETFRAVLVRPEDNPWTDEDCHKAFDMVLEAARERLAAGDRTKSTARRFRLWRDWWLYTWVNTGPPTWYFPHLSFRQGVTVGWIRGAFAVSLRRQK